VGDLLWLFNVLPNVGLSPGNAYVTVQDVLLAIHHHLRTAVKSAEYGIMNKVEEHGNFPGVRASRWLRPSSTGEGASTDRLLE
jgi:hypothetical protein